MWLNWKALTLLANSTDICVFPKSRLVTWLESGSADVGVSIDVSIDVTGAD